MELKLEGHKKFGEIYRYKFFNTTTFVISDPKIYEVILSHPTKYNKKSFFYDLMRPAFGEGLVTSSGIKWQTHRKILTPAFHFAFLGQFVEVFDRLSNTLVDKLGNKINNECVDILPFVKLMSLDVICETAMGTIVDAQNGNESAYVKAVHE